jgi:hypothetical protein
VLLRTELKALLVKIRDELLATELKELGWLLEAELTEPKKELGTVEDTLKSEGLMLDDEIDGELEAVTEVEPDRLEVVLDIELERPDGELDSIVQDTLDKLAELDMPRVDMTDENTAAIELELVMPELTEEL